jgi:hypothetical protein
VTEYVEFEGAMALDDFRRKTGVKMMKYDEGERRSRERKLWENGWEMRVRILGFLRKSRYFVIVESTQADSRGRSDPKRASSEYEVASIKVKEKSILLCEWVFVIRTIQTWNLENLSVGDWCSVEGSIPGRRVVPGVER